MISLKNILCITMLTLICAPSSYASRNPNDGLGLDPEVSIALSNRNISIDHANITNNEDKSQSIVNVMQHPDPGTISGSIKKGVYGGIEGAAANLTSQLIMGGINKGLNLLTNKDPQITLNNKAIADFNLINSRLAQLKSLQEEAEDKEIIEGYEALIKQCKNEINQLLKDHLAQATEQAKKAG
ncbi:MAG: hypothetical protein P4L31_08490 [Candidatus Babeliales bacterium]|nr:hypothetical protein [Candidatus Babeliales bacterium]